MGNNKQKILFVFFTLLPGGAEKVVISLANKIKENFDWDIEFFVYEKSDYLNLKINPDIKLIECNKVINRKSKLSWYYNVYFKFGLLLAGKINHKNYNRIIAVHEQVPEFALFYLLICKPLIYYNITQKFILYIHSSVQDKLTIKKNKRALIFNRFLNILRQKIFKIIIVNSVKIQKELINSYIPSKLLNNPIDFAYIDNTWNLRESLTNDLHNLISSRYFLSVSKVSAVKNLQLLIEAYIESSHNIEENLIIIGYVEDMKLFLKLKKYVEQKGLLNRRIFFLPQQKNPYIFMKNATALICTSLYESFSMSVHEAMYLKTPVIITKFPGHEEYFNLSNSILVDFDKNELSKTLTDFSKGNIDFSKRILKAYQDVLKFDLNKIVEDFAGLLKKK